MLATNLIGTGVDIAMKAGLQKHGLLDKRDYTEIEAPFPTMPALLSEKKADLVTAVMPFALNPLLNEIGFPLFDQTEGLESSQFVFWTARQSYIDAHRAVLIDCMEDMLRIERWYLDPANHVAVAKIASDMLKIPPERFGWLFTHKDWSKPMPNSSRSPLGSVMGNACSTGAATVLAEKLLTVAPRLSRIPTEPGAVIEAS